AVFARIPHKVNHVGARRAAPPAPKPLPPGEGERRLPLLLSTGPFATMVHAPEKVDKKGLIFYRAMFISDNHSGATA
ncbi:MAG: hypothetical protein MUF46_09015, partial [Desulfobacterales bacterium]|nr:hypothetical protein [Desulfobacterales bacterium]